MTLYNTEHEIDFLRELARRPDGKARLRQCRQVITRRTYAGDGMDVDRAAVNDEIARLLVGGHPAIAFGGAAMKRYPGLPLPPRKEGCCKVCGARFIKLSPTQLFCDKAACRATGQQWRKEKHLAKKARQDAGR